jgi:hypothetical protein
LPLGVAQQILTNLELDVRQARAESVGGKLRLEEATGALQALFAWSNGKLARNCGSRDTRIVSEAGFAAAASTMGGVAICGSVLFQLLRFGRWDSSPFRFGVRLLISCVRALPAWTPPCMTRASKFECLRQADDRAGATAEGQVLQARPPVPDL